MLQSIDKLPQGAQWQHQVALRSRAGNKLRGLVEVELACPVVRTVDQEGGKTGVVAELVGSQEGVLEESCAYASSLRALIDGESREEENWAWLRASTGFEGIWEFAAFYCSHRQGVETKCLWFLRCDEDACVSGAVVLPRKSVEPIVYLSVARLEARPVVPPLERPRLL